MMYMNTKYVQMADANAAALRSMRGARRLCRVQVIRALLAICRRIETMQTSPDAQQACRDVHARLETMLRREQPRPRRARS